MLTQIIEYMHAWIGNDKVYEFLARFDFRQLFDLQVPGILVNVYRYCSECYCLGTRISRVPFKHTAIEAG